MTTSISRLIPSQSAYLLPLWPNLTVREQSPPPLPIPTVEVHHEHCTNGAAGTLVVPVSLTCLLPAERVDDFMEVCGWDDMTAASWLAGMLTEGIVGVLKGVSLADNLPRSCIPEAAGTARSG